MLITVQSDYQFRVLKVHAILSGYVHNHSTLICRLHLCMNIYLKQNDSTSFKFIKLQMVNSCEPITNGNEHEQLKNTADQFKQLIIVSQVGTPTGLNTDA